MLTTLNEKKMIKNWIETRRRGVEQEKKKRTAVDITDSAVDSKWIAYCVTEI